MAPWYINYIYKYRVFIEHINFTQDNIFDKINRCISVEAEYGTQ